MPQPQYNSSFQDSYDSRNQPYSYNDDPQYAQHPPYPAADNSFGQGNPYSSQGPPIPPPHRGNDGGSWEQGGYNNSGYSDATPGADNFGLQAGGGLTGIAMSVADANARESGLEAIRNTPGYDPGNQMPHYGAPPSASPYGQSPSPPQHSSSSLTPLGAAAFPPGITTPQSRSIISRSPPTPYVEPYVDQPYRYSQYIDPNLAEFDPNSIEDDGDDGLEYRQRERSSMMSLGHNSSDKSVPTAAAGGAAAGGIMGALGGMVGKNGSKTGPQYDPVNGPYGPHEYNLGDQHEKSEWLSKQSTGSKRLRLLVIFLSVLLILGAIAGGVIGGVLGSRAKSNSNSSTPPGDSAEADASQNGELDKNSDEIKKLLNNKNIHKVFPGIDYTPMYTQYPDCVHYPPSQNNVTRDVAVLSQLSNTIRLYGTDCNQTEMVLSAIDRLGLNGTTKVWMGIWLDKNETTNTRQLQQAYKIFETHGQASFAGVIVGNEVLFRKDMTIDNLTSVIDDVRKHMDSNSIKLPIASSDLGDNWTQAFADKVDILMANIHPFFAGQTAEESAGWTWSFWQNKDVPLKPDLSKNYIAETGWPTKGGKNCGEATTCTTGSVAGITELNSFMESWICPSLTNGTNYFWFSAFDEPWKIKYNEPGKEWEDQWGLMDVNRNLKPGVTIPDCAGKTAP
ncbi:hypothetical protein HYFRA_00001719 [Hymenoscyphus fraxineus]|uniref:glucan endo-1,3-beta-D-glucosidase n=1 Tax=Hymenoscyphus fraxineus TaxID=746836 RepID=A0A9N9PU30_9HELO|nr:hypothetical protein HYFRA_00001719 [Hymenoscyphus fraxineus]